MSTKLPMVRLTHPSLNVQEVDRLVNNSFIAVKERKTASKEVKVNDGGTAPKNTIESENAIVKKVARIGHSYATYCLLASSTASCMLTTHAAAFTLTRIYVAQSWTKGCGLARTTNTHLFDSRCDSKYLVRDDYPSYGII